VHCGSVGSSFGLGFEAGFTLGSTEKRVVLLFQRDLERRVSLLIRENSHSNCTLAPYNDAIEAEALIREVLKTPD